MQTNFLHFMCKFGTFFAKKMRFFLFLNFDEHFFSLFLFLFFIFSLFLFFILDTRKRAKYVFSVVSFILGIVFRLELCLCYAKSMFIDLLEDFLFDFNEN